MVRQVYSEFVELFTIQINDPPPPLLVPEKEKDIMRNIFEGIKNIVHKGKERDIRYFRRENRYFPWGAGIYYDDEKGWIIGFGETKEKARKQVLYGDRG